MIYARVLDSTLADDYFKAMERVEQRLELRLPSKEQEGSNYEIVKVQPDTQLFGLIERLAMPELCQEERVEIAGQLKQVLFPSYASQTSPPVAIVL